MTQCWHRKGDLRLRFACRILGREDLADDAVQEVFIRFHAALSSFRGQSTVKTYLTRIAINKCLDILRSRKRRLLGPTNSAHANPLSKIETAVFIVVSFPASEKTWPRDPRSIPSHRRE